MQKTILTIVLTFLVTIIILGSIFIIWNSKNEEDVLNRQDQYFEKKEQEIQEITVDESSESSSFNSSSNIQQRTQQYEQVVDQLGQARVGTDGEFADTVAVGVVVEEIFGDVALEGFVVAAEGFADGAAVGDFDDDGSFFE